MSLLILENILLLFPLLIILRIFLLKKFFSIIKKIKKIIIIEKFPAKLVRRLSKFEKIFMKFRLFKILISDMKWLI